MRWVWKSGAEGIDGERAAEDVHRTEGLEVGRVPGQDGDGDRGEGFHARALNG